MKLSCHPRFHACPPSAADAHHAPTQGAGASPKWPIDGLSLPLLALASTLLWARNFGEYPSPLKNVREAVWISDDCCPGGVGRLPERSVSEAAGPRPAPSSSVPCARNRAAALCSVPWRSAAPLRSPARAS